MADSSSADLPGAAVMDPYALQAKITHQSSRVREMKKAGTFSAQEVLNEVNILTALREELTKLTASGQGVETDGSSFNRKAFDELILRKMYVVPAFEIHNGPAGLFDYGPPACALKANVVSDWRRHFPLEEGMLEMECTNLTPSSVLEASGHVERFTDFMVKDAVTGECFRGDKLLEDAIDALLLSNPHMPLEEQEQHKIVQRQADALNAEELHAMLQRYHPKSPSCPENDLTKPFAFNLMFRTTIGPEGTAVGFLRPETAQGLFVNFRRLLDYNQQRMPFAAAQVGLGFRNEIAPRNGLLRVREFCMAEIEHFVHPERKQHPKFELVSNKELVLFSADAQLSTGRTTKMAIGAAVEQGIVANQTLGYFMARTQLWLEGIGVKPSGMRFRQHLRTEMAHYAADCWDMEIKMSYGWIECVGHADRSCYDLVQHSTRSGVPMVASERLPEPILEEKLVAEPNKKLIGPRFKGDQRKVITALESLDGETLNAFKASIEADGIAKLTVNEGESNEVYYEIEKQLVTFSIQKKTVVERKFIPSVIEPSFGIGRILYAVLEHSFSQREGDEQRCVMAFPPKVAPIKVGIFRLTSSPLFDPLVAKVKSVLHGDGLVCRIDSSSGTVGRRYARADELGIPFGVTIDFQSLVDESVTVRDRDTMAQIRVSFTNLLQLLIKLVDGTWEWSDAIRRYPIVKSNSDDETTEPEKGGLGDMKVNAEDSAMPVIVEYNTRASFSRPNPAHKF